MPSDHQPSPPFPGPASRPGRIAAGIVLAVAAAAVKMPAVTLSELLRDPQMTPKRFASHFEDFAYEFHPEIQEPEVFLENRRGDCDDYAVTADLVLARKNFGTRLVQIRLAGRVDHAVCYVTESRAYLDYNNRRVFFTLARSGPTLREIATKVAGSLESNWTSAFEFTYQDRNKKVVAVVVKTDPPANDPPPGGAPGASVKVGF